MALKIGEKIRELRKARNLSQESLATLLGVSFQAVSKWETGIGAPDIGLIPSIAAYFGVSIDELFDYNTLENERVIDELCREAMRVRSEDPSHAEHILREGLRRFPGNETILAVLMYHLSAMPDRERDLIDTCEQLIPRTTNEGVKYDALRIQAETNKRVGEDDRVRPLLEQIPEFYFTKLECVARLTEGEESLEAARFQMNRSGSSTVEMLKIMAARYTESGDREQADRCMRIARRFLEVFRSEGGEALEVPGYEWLEA